jgi:hypothetical protein
VDAARANYTGPIRLAIQGLPAGIQIAGDEIGAEDNIGLVTLTAPSGAPAHSLGGIVGRAETGDPPLVRVARSPETNASRDQPWLTSQLALAIAEPAPLGIAWLEDAGQTPLLGGSLPLRVQLMRSGDNQNAIRLRLLTTQTTPQKKEKQNNQDVLVDDLERTLRLDSAAEFGPETQEAVVHLLVPPDLPVKRWGLVLVAELLSADKQSVTAAVATPIRHIEPARALAVELAGPATIEARAGDGATGAFTGKLVRREGFLHPVTVTLAGLPEGYPAPSVTVPGDQHEFTLEVRFPAEAKPADLNEIKLVATALTDAANPKSLIRSAGATVALKVVAGEKPKP